MDRNADKPESAAVGEVLRDDRSLYSTQLAVGFHSLRFMPELEDRFLESYRDHVPSRVKRALIIGFVMTLLFILSDYQRLPPEVFRQLIAPRAVQLFALFLVMVVVWRDIRALMEPFAGLTLVVYGTTTPIMMGLINSSGYYSPISAQLLILTICYFLSGLRFFHAGVAGAIITLAYPSSQMLYSAQLPHLAMNCYALLACNVLGMSGAYFLEYTTRENYLGGRLLEEMALFDGLTGLLNRTAFAIDLEKSCRQGIREQAGVAVAMVDVDHFKQYNDYFGHQQGDQCLRRIAEALADAAKRPLDKVGRYGGEEFILAWYDCDEAGARELGELARRSVEQLAIAQGPKASQPLVTISVGVSSCEAGEKCSSEELIRTADRALYRAKHNGRNRVEVDRAMYTGTGKPEA